MKSVIFSFDYELFLGADSGKVTDCLIQPTQKLVRILSKRKIKGIFFVDTIYLLRLGEVSTTHPEAKRDYDRLFNQLRALHKAGHYLFIHLHPHWLDAEYLPSTNTWSLSNAERYRISTIDESKKRALFSDSIQLLCEITGESNRRVFNGYRAGGWSITPFSDFKSLFLKNDIQYDFTVIPGKYLFSTAQYFDFRNAPEKSVYAFEEDVCVEYQSGRFKEFPVSVCEMSSSLNRINVIYEKLKHVFLRTLRLEKHKGFTVQSQVEDSGDAEHHRGKIRIPAQFENLNIFTFISLYRQYRKTGHLHSVSHPKIFKNWDYIYMRLFLFLVSFNDSIQSDFTLLD